MKLKISIEARKAIKFLYDKHLQGHSLNDVPVLMIHKFKWNRFQWASIINYMKDKDWIDGVWMMGSVYGIDGGHQNFLFKKITSTGIDYVEENLS